MKGGLLLLFDFLFGKKHSLLHNGVKFYKGEL